MLFRSTVVLGFVLQALLFAPARADDGKAAIPAFPAPDFVAQSLVDDVERRLSDFQGQVVLLNFWASWCFPCRYEMPAFQKMYDRYRDRGFTVVAVAVYDELVNARSFQQRYKFSFPMLFDEREEARQAFDVKVVPQTFLVDRAGKLVPITDPTTGQTALSVNDPTLWEDPDMMSFIERLIGQNAATTTTHAPQDVRASKS